MGRTGCGVGTGRQSNTWYQLQNIAGAPARFNNSWSPCLEILVPLLQIQRTRVSAAQIADRTPLAGPWRARRAAGVATRSWPAAVLLLRLQWRHGGRRPACCCCCCCCCCSSAAVCAKAHNRHRHANSARAASVSDARGAHTRASSSAMQQRRPGRVHGGSRGRRSVPRRSR